MVVFQIRLRAKLSDRVDGQMKPDSHQSIERTRDDESCISVEMHSGNIVHMAVQRLCTLA